MSDWIAEKIAELEKIHGKSEVQYCVTCWLVTELGRKCGHSDDESDRDGCLRFRHRDGKPFFIQDFKLDKDGCKHWVYRTDDVKQRR